MTGRDAIAEGEQSVCVSFNVKTDVLAAAFTAAGFRILAPGDLDKVTLERAAKLTTQRLEVVKPLAIGAAVAVFNALPDAIRSLGGGET